MAYITSHKSPTIKTELDLFAVPPTQNSVESGSIHCCRPVSALTDTSPIEFIIPASSEEYIDLSHTALHLVVKINATANQNVAPVNNFLHSMFSQVDVFLNQRNICPPTSHYSYRSYIESLLNYGIDAKRTHLQTCMWYKDDAGQMDTMVLDEDAGTQNSGYETRKAIARGGRTFELYGQLHCDIFNQNKYLVNGVEVAIRLVKEKPQFCLMSNAAGASFEITEANLFVRKVRVNPSILVAHARTLAACPARYPITRVEIKTVSISAGIQSKSVDNLYIGQMPKRCIVGFVSNERVNGTFGTNPFNFESFNFDYLSLFIDSRQIPAKPYQPNFQDGLYARNYSTLFSDTGILFSDTGNDISYSEYPNGYCITVFDLTADMSCHDQHWNIIQSGTLRFEVRFAAALTNTVTAIIYSEFDNLIEIGENRTVSLDYSS